jgi:tryptophan halogenase
VVPTELKLKEISTVQSIAWEQRVPDFRIDSNWPPSPPNAMAISPPASSIKSIRKVIVLGGGSAGLLAALTVRRLQPKLCITLIHSPQIGVIGVGEGTTAVFPHHLFETLGIPKERFYRDAQPTWKQGIRFIWGARGDYYYDFGFQYDLKYAGLPLATGFYCDNDCYDLNETCAMMRLGKSFKLGPLGRPLIRGQYAFHIENAKLVTCLESIVRESGVTVIEDTLEHAEVSDDQVLALHLASGRRQTADLYIDASGFRSELLGRALAEPFKSFADSLFCDRAVIGGWQREDEPIHAYTTAETMDAGWCWKIEHEHFINRGYVYSSSFIEDEAAAEEFLRHNPKISSTPRSIRFRSGRHFRSWVGNVVAIGNASGFVEPLEATALAQVIYASGGLCDALGDHADAGIPPEVRENYNFTIARAWDEIRDFLAFHYKFNTLRITPFWRHCQSATPLGDFAGFYEAYCELGPAPELIHALPFRPNLYGIEGYLAHLVGMAVPHAARHIPTPAERETFERSRSRTRAAVTAAATCAETLSAIRAESWQFA